MHPALLAALRERSDSYGRLSYRDYIDVVLYTPGIGYYRRDTTRVGRNRSADFYTAESLGSVFRRLILSAAETLTSKEFLRKATFVEIGAEPEAGLLEGFPGHPFSQTKIIRPVDSLTIEGPAILFANEWLDALPFHRIIFTGNYWQERGVHLSPDGRLSDILLPSFSEPVAQIVDRLPKTAPEGYQLDLPLAAEAALKDLMNAPWDGLVLLFDYGRTWKALTQDFPEGTARTYSRHKQGNDLLTDPGMIDITCDVDWTHLQRCVQAADCSRVELENQETFFIRRAESAAKAIIEEGAGIFSKERQTLLELTHPAQMGQKFQVLWATRGLD